MLSHQVIIVLISLVRNTRLVMATNGAKFEPLDRVVVLILDYASNLACKGTRADRRAAISGRGVPAMPSDS